MPWVVNGNTVEVVPVTIPEQLSVVVGAIGVPEHSPTVTSANTGVTGAVISSTITFCVDVVVLPFPSSNVHCHQYSECFSLFVQNEALYT